MDDAGALPGLILAAPHTGRRRLVALAGPPASGKSTLAETLARDLTAQGCPAEIVPMDGFHLDNRILSRRGLIGRKGAPESFDAAGLLRLLSALRDDAQVHYPVFNRERDISIGGAGEVGEGCDTVIVEGNYLLLDAPVWREMARQWDISIQLEVPLDVLEARLTQRWRDHAIPEAEAKRRIHENDLVNARHVAANALAADYVVRAEEDG
ncbi:nucleoside/nucleotide kinase family protein [Vannielia litorea]|nr:nucleoside/nucleotide kinase family protein [Vannielia litorea]